MTEKLESCPFCGHEPALFTNEDGGRTLYLLHCVDPYCGIHTPIYGDLAELKEYWNAQRRGKEVKA